MPPAGDSNPNAPFSTTKLLPLEVGAVAAFPAGEGPATATTGTEAVVPGAVAIRATSDTDTTELDDDGDDE